MRNTDNLLFGKTEWQLHSRTRSEKEEMGRGGRNGKTNTDPVFQKRTEDKTGAVGGGGTTIEANSGAGIKTCTSK